MFAAGAFLPKVIPGKKSQRKWSDGSKTGSKVGSKIGSKTTTEKPKRQSFTSGKPELQHLFLAGGERGRPTGDKSNRDAAPRTHSLNQSSVAPLRPKRTRRKSVTSNRGRARRRSATSLGGWRHDADAVVSEPEEETPLPVPPPPKAMARLNTAEKLEGLFGPGRYYMGQYIRRTKRLQAILPPPSKLSPLTRKGSSVSNVSQERGDGLKLDAAKSEEKLEDLHGLLGGVGPGVLGLESPQREDRFLIEEDEEAQGLMGVEDIILTPFGKDYDTALMTAKKEALTTVRVDDVPIVDGIPVGLLKARQQWHLMITHICLLLGLICLFQFWYPRLILNVSLPLTRGVSANIEVKNCAIGFYSTSGKSRVDIKAYLSRLEDFSFFSATEPPYKENPETGDIDIDLRIANYNIYFLCAINFYLNNDTINPYMFKSLRVKYLVSEDYLDVYADTPIRAETSVDISLHHAIASFESIEAPDIFFRIQGGSLKFVLDGTQATYHSDTPLTVDSFVAPVTVITSIPLMVYMPQRVASYAFLKGGGVSTKLLNNGLVEALVWRRGLEADEAADISTTFEMKGTQSPLYVVARAVPKGPDETENLDHLFGWAGREHLTTPHLAPFAAAKLREASDWVNGLPDTSWRLTLPISAENDVHGTWKLFSGNALLGSSIYFSLFSAGFLEPQSVEIPVHVLGQFCRNSRARSASTAMSKLGVSSDLKLTSTKDTDKGFWGNLFGTEKSWSEVWHEVAEETGIEQRDVKPVFVSTKTSTPSTLKDTEEGFDESISAISRRLSEATGDLAGLTPDVVGAYISDLRAIETCQKEMRFSEFLALKEALDDIVTPRSVFVWELDYHQIQIRYDIKADAILTNLVTWIDRGTFLVAAGLNFLGAVCIGLYIVKQLIGTVEKIVYIEMEFDEPIIRQQSHRLAHEVTTPRSPAWYINVQSVFRPNIGFKIRWTHRVGFYRIAIVAERVDTDWRVTSPRLLSGDYGELSLTEYESQVTLSYLSGGADSELYSSYSTPVESTNVPSTSLHTAVDETKSEDKRQHTATFIYLPASAVKVVDTMSGYQREVEIPIVAPPLRKPEHYILDSRQRWSLDQQAKYRFKVMGLDELGIVQEESSGSNEIVCAGDIYWNETSGFLLKRALRSNFSSWYFFVSKCLRPIITDLFIMKIHKFQLEIREAQGALTTQEKVRTTAERCVTRPSHYVIAMGWGRRTHLARRTFLLTNRKVYGATAFKGRAIAQVQASGEILWHLSFPKSAEIQLKKDRATQRVLSIDIQEALTGEVVATGRFSFFEMMQIQFLQRGASLSSLPVSCDLHNVGIGGFSGALWGTLRAELDASCLRPYSFAERSSVARNSVSTSEIQPPETTIPRINTHNTHFSNLCPGMTLLNGKDFEIQWAWSKHARKIRCVYLYLYDAVRHTPILSLAQGKEIPNNGSFFWAVDISMGPSDGHAVAYLVMMAEPLEEHRKPLPIAISHGFFVVKTLLLPVLEYAYAAFCRTYDLEMEHLTEKLLAQSGFTISEEPVRICPGLRRPLPFERQVACVHTPGQCMVSSTSKLVSFRPADVQAFRWDQLSNAEVFKSITRNLKVIHNVMIDPDPFYWTQSHDVCFLKRNTFVGSYIPYNLMQLKTSLFLSRERIFTKAISPEVEHTARPTKSSTEILSMINPRHLLTQNSQSQLSNISVMLNRHETHHEYSMRRFICFEVWGQVSWVPRWWIVFWTLHIINIQVIGFSFLLNAIVAAYTQRYHRDVTTIYFSDFFFDLEPSFFWHCAQPYSIIFTIFTFDFFIKWIGLVIASGVYGSFPTIAQRLHLFCLLTYSIITTLTMAIIPMFVLWFLVAVLIDTNGCLPSAIMCAASLYTLQATWQKYTYARNYITDHVNRNTNALLSMLLDAWFETNGLVYTDNRTAIDTDNQLQSLSTDVLLGLKKEIKKIRLRATYLGDKVFEEATGNEFVTPEDVCFYRFRKVVPTTGSGLWYDRAGRPQGLEFEPSISMKSRFATIRDYEMHPRLFQSMLLGYECAMLEDGVLHGPRAGYHIDAPPQPNSHWAFAIAAEPVYPPPATLNLSAKAGLVFLAFDKDGDRRLTEVEFSLWQEILKKPFAARTFPDVVLCYNTEYRSSATAKEGFSVLDLKQYYIHAGETELNNDYQRLFKIVEHDNLLHQVVRQNSHTIEIDSDDSRGDVDDKPLNEPDQTQAGDPNSEEIVTVSTGQKERSTQEVAEKLRNSVTARKLNVVFQHLTRDQTKQALGRLTDPDVLARNFFYSQFVLLSPTVGQQYLLNLASSNVDTVEDQVVIQPGDKGAATKNPAVIKALQNWTRCVCLAYEDTFLRLAREISNVYTQIFNPDNVRRGINDFFDRIMAERIQFKAMRLTSTSIILAPGDIHPSHVAQLYRFPAKTASHTLRALNTVWLTNQRVQSLAAITATDPSKKYELGVVTECLVAIGLLKQSETVEHVARMTGATLYMNADIVKRNGGQVPYRVPKSKACEELIIRSLARAALQRGVNVKREHLAREPLESLVRRIILQVDQAIHLVVTQYLSFPAFLLLLQLMGVSLIDDELPTNREQSVTGSTAKLEEAENDMTPLDDGDEDYEIWRDYLSDVAEIPSLKPRLLNILTEDEAREITENQNFRKENDYELFQFLQPELLMMNLQKEREDEDQLLRLRLMKARYTRNIKRSRAVFNQIGQHSGFLPAELADEAVFLVFDNRLGLSGTRACLKYLCVDSPDPHVGKPLTQAWKFPNPEETTVIHLHAAPDQETHKLDWSYYRHSTGWTPDLIEAYRKLTSSSPGFIGKSQILEFIRLVEAKFITSEQKLDKQRWHQYEEGPRNDAGWVNRRYQRRRENQMNEWQTIIHVMVTPDMFRRVTSNLNLSVSRQHATLFWYLICHELSKSDFEAFIPAAQVCGTFTRILFQPITQSRNKYFGTALTDIHDFNGCLPQFALTFLLRAMGLEMHEKYVRAIWEDLPKDSLSLKWCLTRKTEGSHVQHRADSEMSTIFKSSVDNSDDTDNLSVMSTLSTQSGPQIEESYEYLLRVDMDPTGLDPTKGACVNFRTLRKHLTQMLMTGLPPEGLSIFVRLACHLDVENDRMEAVMDRYRWALSRYGVFKPHVLVPILCTLHVEGVSFLMLRTIVDQMRLKLPERDVKRIFDLMDINQNRFLELAEILFGFEMLCKIFIPDYIIQLLSYDPYNQLQAFATVLMACLILVAFLGFTVRSFASGSEGLSRSMQTLLAVAGAVAFRSSTRSDDPELDLQIMSKMTIIFGDDFEKRYIEAIRPDILSLKDLEADNDQKRATSLGHQLRIRYVLPRNHLPDNAERHPCAFFYIGDEVMLDPVVTGHGGDVKRLLWSMIPCFPPAMGLNFHSDTGVITGRIGGSNEEIQTKGITAKSITQHRTTFIVTCRHPTRGVAKFYLTLRILDRPILANQYGGPQKVELSHQDNQTETSGGSRFSMD